VVFTGDEHHDGALLVDIDRDGDLDIISIGWSHNRVILYENLAAPLSPTPPPSPPLPVPTPESPTPRDQHRVHLPAIMTLP
jgi:hypothetical protein